MEEDDIDFTPSPNTSSNLASLFGFNKKSSQENSSLTYVAPKAPKRDSSPANKKPIEEKTSKSVILISKAVHAYKFINNTYVSQGLTGVIISGNHDSFIYDIILYKPSKEHLSKTRISKNFILTIATNNYVSFYDNNNQTWSVMFQSSKDVEQFAIQVAFWKFYSYSEPPESILIQDLSPPTQPQVQLHNTVEVAYISQYLKPKALSGRKEAKKKIKLSDSSFAPLTQGLIGCGEGCKRAIIASRSLSGTWRDEMPADCSLFLEVKVEKVISESENSIPQTKQYEDKPESPIDSSAEETSIKARGVSIKEALDATKFQKAILISRMARMGQATLPLKQGLPNGPSDSEDEVAVASSPKLRTPRSRAATSSVIQNTTHTTSTQIQKPEGQLMPMYQNDIMLQQSQLAKSGMTFQQVLPVSASPISSPTTDPNFSVYVSESRVQAAELRMGISKLSDKLDVISNKLQNLNLGGGEMKTHQPALLDSNGILSSIQSMITENESLKVKVEEQKLKIEQQNDRIFQLLELNHKYLEQNSTSQGKQSENESKLKTEMESLLTKEIQLETENKEAFKQIQKLENDIVSSEEKKKDLLETVERLNAELEKYKRNSEENGDAKKKETEDWEKKMSKAAEAVGKLKGKLKEVVTENENLKSLLRAQKKEMDVKSEEVKDSQKKNEEYEKTVEGLKKQISVEENKSESRIDELLKLIAKLEKDNKQLTVQMEESPTQKQEIKNLVLKMFSALTNEFSAGKEYSASVVLSTIAKCFQDVSGVSVPREKFTQIENEEKVSDKAKETPAVVPMPRTTIQNIKVAKSEPKEVVPTEKIEKESSPLVENKKPEFEREDSKEDEQSDKKESNNRYKSYDQSWRTTNPPPPPLFDDDDDDDDWLN